jgi:hypothetical protein
VEEDEVRSLAGHLGKAGGGDGGNRGSLGQVGWGWLCYPIPILSLLYTL